MRHFARGLTEAGARVRVISQNEPEGGEPNYLGIPYEGMMDGEGMHLGKKGLLSKTKWLTRWLGAAKRMAQRVEEIVGLEQVDVVIQYNLSWYALEPFNRLCRRRGVALVRDVVEWEGVSFFRGGFFNPLFIDAQVGMRFSIVRSEGVIGISEYLRNYYASRGVPAICVPAIIEIPEQMPKAGKKDEKEFNVVYLGQMAERDCPIEMVQAIRQVLIKGLPVRFTIVGSKGEKGVAGKARVISETDKYLRGKVEFLGRVSDEDVIRILTTADALLLVRPDDVVTRAAFPTRLPEYLTSGTPVIITGVGDIPKYLRDGIDGMVIGSCTPEAIAERIEMLMNMPDRGRRIAEGGFECAKKNFDYKSRTKEILEFIETLKRRQK
jgi:Glycosyltransferase